MAAFFTELFRIDPSDAESLLDPELERDSESSLWLRNLGDLELVGLWESLPNAQPDGTLMADVLSDPESEKLVFSLPDNFVSSIESVSDDQVDMIVEKWSEMEELSGWELSELAQVVRDVRSLVREARANKQIVVQLAEM